MSQGSVSISEVYLPQNNRGRRIKILVAGGASAGHLNPALAFAKRLTQEAPGLEVGLVCLNSQRGLDCLKERFSAVYFLSIISFRLKFRRLPRFLYYLIKSFFESFLIIERFKPDVVVGFGSYSSVPIILEAALFKKATLIHEQNVSLGRANRLLSLFADKTALSFNSGRVKKERFILTGNPLLKPGKEISKEDAGIFFGLGRKFTVLIFGGSQGSSRINRDFKGALEALSERYDFQFIHICGKYDYYRLKKHYNCIKIKYRVFEFLSDMHYAYKLADVVVCRAGAATISELAYFNKAAILIPYPYAAGHQVENALLLKDSNAAVVLEEKDLNPAALSEQIAGLMRSGQRRKSLEENIGKFSNPDADLKLVNLALSLLARP